MNRIITLVLILASMSAKADELAKVRYVTITNYVTITVTNVVTVQKEPAKEFTHEGFKGPTPKGKGAKAPRKVYF